jgi:hypothetical protein
LKKIFSALFLYEPTKKHDEKAELLKNSKFFLLLEQQNAYSHRSLIKTKINWLVI